MNHRYFIRYFLIAAENRLKCLIPTFPLTTDLYYWELMSLSSRCSQIYSHHDKSQKRSMPAPSTRVAHGGPDTPWNRYLGSALESPVKSVSADFHLLLLMASSACEDWQEDGQSHFHPHLSPPIYETIKRKHLTWFTTYHQDFLLPFLYLLPIPLTTVKQLYWLSRTNA